MGKEAMSVKSLLNTKQAVLESKLSILLDHPVTKGEHCESAWIDFFRSFLPSKYAIDKGFVFDARGRVSDQIDIIIYDALYSPLIFGTDSGEKFVTAESVYAVFDSKPTIDKTTLGYTHKKIRSVTCLDRSNRVMISAGKPTPARDPIHILGGILAVDSVEPSTIEEHLNEFTAVDVGCAIRRTAFLAVREADCSLREFKPSSAEEAVVAFFYIMLDELYKLGTVAGIDIRDYADATVSSLKLNRGDF